MTLTHIIPSLRASVPDPICRDLWPEFTTTSLADVTVAGVSLTRLAEWCGTPCVHTAAAVVPGTGGMPSSDDLASVLVTRVRELSAAADGSLPEDLTIHDLRHTAASLAIASGANVKAVQRMLGHASAAMTLDVYADLFDDDLDSVSLALHEARARSI